MSSPSTPSIARSTAPEAPKENALVRLFITPITIISFLLSLTLIDTHNHHLRTHHSHHNRSPPTTIFGHVKQFLHSLVFKHVPESPYGYIKSPDATAGSGSRSGSVSEREKEKEPWHWHTKQRHLMKKEMDDAFKVRHWVVVFMMLCGVAVVVGGSLVLRWCLGVLWDWS